MYLELVRRKIRGMLTKGNVCIQIVNKKEKSVRFPLELLHKFQCEKRLFVIYSLDKIYLNSLYFLESRKTIQGFKNYLLCIVYYGL